MENPADDPREFQHAHGGFDDGEFPADMDGFLGLSSWRANVILCHGYVLPHSSTPYSPSRQTKRILRHEYSAIQKTSITSPAVRRSAQRTRSNGLHYLDDDTVVCTDSDIQVDGTGFTIRIQGSPDGRARTIIMGNSPRHGGPDDVPMFPQFMSGNTDTRPDGHVINGPLMAQYLLAMLANRPGRGDPFHEIFGGMLGPEGGESGRWGDYVFNQEALDQIITQIMENSNSTAPVPASGEVMENLPRDVLEEGSPLLQKDCAVCKEQFKLETDDPDEQVVVTLPCKHPFHESCIMPWLKSSGTCPVCRYQLVPQPEHHAPGPGPPRGSSSGSGGPGSPPPRTSSPSRDRSQGRSGLFGFLGFGNAGGNSNGQTGSSSRPSADSSRSGRDHSSHIPGGWDEQMD
ncbi:hypothetical protein AcV5_005004 [Taiwanofungus camphoratus]|nr:hypothetical protein AcW2_000400 [Antrodia cinnamomea]KAI0937002.1 hypothetical protein AcV5_005004 [Antrodia cinnamomea]